MEQGKKNLAARAAYQMYGKSVDFKNFQGNPMPEWNDLPEAIKTAWEWAAEAVANLVVNGFESNLVDVLSVPAESISATGVSEESKAA